jgi:Flp pilus assembly secretin CpaC
LGGAAIFIVRFCTLDANAQIVGEAITFNISGSAGVEGVTMTGLPGQAGQTVVTDQNGYYSATVKYGWSGTVKPVKEGWTFDEASKTYARVTSDLTNENYTPTPITYTISGKVTGTDGVELRGLPGNPITGPDGSYSVTVPYGWAEMVTPTKEGFEFKPFNKGFSPVRSNMVQNFTAEAVKLLITGTVGEAGVTMSGLPGNIVTGANGVFSVKVDYGWSGVITPQKEGYEFEPASQQYDNIIVGQTNENFTAKPLTYTVSGTAGMAGVVMKGLPGEPVTDENGYFIATVNHGLTATVTPTKPGWEFDPGSMILAKVTSDRTNLTFSAETIKLTISGTTRPSGVELNGLPGNPVSGADGRFSVEVDYGWTGTVMPIKEGYKFTPESKTFQPVAADMANQSFNGTKLTYTITGSTGVSNVTLKGLPAGRTVISSASGAYTATVEHGWTGEITPVKDGYEFQPKSIQLSNVMAPMSNQDFMPTLLQRRISGTMRSGKGQPVADVTIVADNNGGQAITDASGQFELLVDYGWGGRLTPLKDGYTFSPTNRPYARVTTDQSNQAFTATVKMFDVTGEVILGGVPIDGVMITADDGSGQPISATTDLKGKYKLQVPYGFTGEIIPTKEGIRFNPPSIPLVNVTTNVVNGEAVAPPPPPRPVIPPTQPRGPVTPPVEVTPPPGPDGPAVDPSGRTPPDVIVPDADGKTPPPGPIAADGQPETDLERRLREAEEKLRMLADGTAGPTARPAVPQDPASALITNSWMEDDLVLTVLPDIANAAGITIIPDDVVAMTPPLVTATLDNVPLDKALSIVLAGTSFVVKKTPDYYLVASSGMTDPSFARIAETRRVKLNYITAEAAVALLSTSFKPYVQSEIPVVEATGTDTTARRISQTYTVLVTAPPDLMERIVADLMLIDKPPVQVLLKARIVAMERTDLLNLGVEWGWPTMQLGFFSGNNYGLGDPSNDFGGKSPWGIQMGYTPDMTFTNALQMTLNLLTVNGEATILSKPQVLAQDGKLATMKVVNEEYYFLSANNPGSNQLFYSSSQLETIESGTTLSITPHIGENEDITLQVSIEVSDSIARGRDSELPVVTRRTADNTVTIKDGGTVALAGLTQDRSITTHKKTPLLSKIPVIGGLFNNADDMSNTREVAVFVTAHILRHGSQEAAGIPRALDQSAMSPVRQTPVAPPVDSRFSPTPRDDRFSPAPRDDRFAPAPRDDRFAPAPRDDRFAPAPRDDRFAPAPRDEGFTTAPRDDRYSTPRVDDRFNRTPYRRPPSSNFQAELNRSLTNSQRR